MFNTTVLISKKTYNILTSPFELVSFSDTSAILLMIQLLQDLYFVHKHRLQSQKVKQIPPLSIKVTLLWFPIVSLLHFPLSKPSCHKLQEKIIMKLVIVLSLDTNHQSGWTLLLILMIAIFFFYSYKYFFHIIGKISLLCENHPCQILPIFYCYLPSQQLMQNNCP